MSYAHITYRAFGMPESGAVSSFPGFHGAVTMPTTEHLFPKFIRDQMDELAQRQQETLTRWADWLGVDLDEEEDVD